MYSGYWKVVAEEEAREICLFFTPDGNQRWKVMPMGDLNVSPTFLATTMKLQTEWDTIAKECGLENFVSKCIVDYVLFYVCTPNQLLAYFRTVLDVLKHHRATLKTKKYNGFRTGVSL